MATETPPWCRAALALALAALLGLGAGQIEAAAAQPLAPPARVAIDRPAPARAAPARLQLAVHGDLRITALDGQRDRFVDDAMAYGWRIARARPLLGGRADVHYLLTPLVDVGASAGLLGMTFAAAATSPDERLAVTWTSLAASARLHWAQGRPFVPEPRADVGVAEVVTTIHGVDQRRWATFTRVGVDWRLGVRRGGVTVALGYTLVGADRGDGPRPPLGGLDLSLGPYLRF
ncbi:MAG: hypothetical protein R3B06_26045 [Kofleriaceae bacterium]